MGAQEKTDGRSVTLAVLIFAAAFVATAAMLHACLRNSLRLHADVRSEKLAIMDQWQGKAYSASFGSSHVHYGFDPRTFDKELAGTPAQTRSINLGMAGGSQTEQRVTALEFVQHMQAPPAGAGPGAAKACLLVLELEAGANFTTEHLVHPRAINIYDWQTMQFVIALAPRNLGLARRLGRIGFAAIAMVMHHLNVGMLSSEIFSPPLNQGLVLRDTAGDRRGVLTLPSGDQYIKLIQPMIDASPKQRTTAPGELVPGNTDLIDELEQASPVDNLQFVYLVLPRIDNLGHYEVFPDSLNTHDRTVPIINLGRPDRFPELYQAKYWFDDSHLNGEGAAVATRLAARDLKSFYKEHGAPPRCGE